MIRVFFLACALVAVNGWSRELKDKFLGRLKEIEGGCAPEVGANADDIAEIMAHKAPSRHEGECMILCFYKRLDMMNDDGTINKEGALKLVDPLRTDDPDLYLKFIAIGKHCSEEVPEEEDKCKYATNLAQCGVKKGKEMGLDQSLFE
ncbi:hypothetical protein HHI36_010364 [Cryptolaemus montrouzieri]|uniref:Uncharacterized protein n=1 Tax=Cryptolaemus montrouzieri TaxID=559131 RepID=A0ABD2MIH6_9CUCU